MLAERERHNHLGALQNKKIELRRLAKNFLNGFNQKFPLLALTILSQFFTKNLGKVVKVKLKGLN